MVIAVEMLLFKKTEHTPLDSGISKANDVEKYLNDVSPPSVIFPNKVRDLNSVSPGSYVIFLIKLIILVVKYW